MEAEWKPLPDNNEAASAHIEIAILLNKAFYV